MNNARERWFWTTQALTATRVILAFLFVVLTPFAQMWPLVALIYSMAWITDFIDGRMARSHHVASRFGAAMDIFGDRYLVVVSLVYAAMRGVNLAIIGIILIRELYSVSMKMVHVDGHGFMISNPKVGGLVHIITALGTLNLISHPAASITPYYQAPFLVICIFYIVYFPWTIKVSWQRLWSTIRSDLKNIPPTD